jgi:hypothetical protein
MSSLVIGVIWLSRKLIKRKSVLCGPNTGVIGGGAGAGLPIVLNPEFEVVGNIELESTPQAVIGDPLSVAPCAVVKLSKKSSVGVEVLKTSFCLFAKDASAFQVSNATKTNANRRALQRVFV